MWLMVVATILNILGLVWALALGSALGYLTLVAGLVLSLVPWLKSVLGASPQT